MQAHGRWRRHRVDSERTNRFSGDERFDFAVPPDTREVAIYRFEGEIAQVWFFNEPSKPEDFSAVFAFG